MDTTPKKRGRPKKIAKELYIAILEANGKKYEESGDTALGAIAKLSPEFYKTKGVIHLQKGDKKSSALMYTLQMRRIFANPRADSVPKQLLAKRLEIALD